jgi:UBX domain-containing protein 1/4
VYALRSSCCAGRSHLGCAPLAVKTKHTNFAESAEEIKPLSPEEKAAQAALLQEKIKKLRAEREARDEAERVNEERLRRVEAQQSQVRMSRQHVLSCGFFAGADACLRSNSVAIASRKSWKSSPSSASVRPKTIAKVRCTLACPPLPLYCILTMELLARQRVLDQIKRDREEREAAAAVSAATSTASGAAGAGAASAPAAATVPARKDYTETRINVRFSGGSVVLTLPTSHTVAQLYEAVAQQDPSFTGSLATTIPRRVLDRSSTLTLAQADLVPSAVLVAQAGPR